jgi:hypothetical protein
MKPAKENAALLKRKIRILCEIAADLRADGQVDCPMLPWNPETGTDVGKCINDCPRCFSEYANSILGVNARW